MDNSYFQTIQFVILFSLSIYSIYQTIQFIRLLLIINLFFIENKTVRYKEMVGIFSQVKNVIWKIDLEKVIWKNASWKK